MSASRHSAASERISKFRVCRENFTFLTGGGTMAEKTLNDVFLDTEVNAEAA
jgi:hypothetical protein